MLLYDLTSTYFEGLCEQIPKARHGYSRDGRRDCRQVVIALVVTPEGLPLAYEVLPGNTVDQTTLRDFLDKIEERYGKARRMWVMDRGIPTEATLAEMRQAEGGLSGGHARVDAGQAGAAADEPALAAGPPGRAGQAAGQQDGEVYVLAQSEARRQEGDRHAAAEAPQARGTA